MITDPARYLEPFRDAGADGCTVHVEVGETAALIDADARPRPAGGPGRQSRTPPSRPSSPTSTLVDLVLCMTVFPGFGGQSFIADVLPEGGRRCGRPPTRPGSTLDVEVDGGIDEHTVVDAARAGANVFVAGSAVFDRADPLGGGRRHPGAAAAERAGRSAVLTGRPSGRRTPTPHGCCGPSTPPSGSGAGRRPTRGWAPWSCPPAAEGGPSAWFTGATAPPGGPHAEVAALAAAGERARGGTLYVTLEPCAHHGRTPPCTDAIVAAGVGPGGGRDRATPIRRSTAGDRRAARAAGVEVDVGVAADAVAEQLAAYVPHRRPDGRGSC